MKGKKGRGKGRGGRGVKAGSREEGAHGFAVGEEVFAP